MKKINLFLSLNRALLGEIPSKLRAAAVKYENHELVAYFYFNGDFTEDEYEDANCAHTEVLCDCSDPLLTGDIVVERLDFPKPLPNVGVYVFSRDTLLPHPISCEEVLAEKPEIRAVVSINQAMFGDVNPNLRNVSLKSLETSLAIYFYFDRELDATINDWVERIMNRVRPDFPDCPLEFHKEFFPVPQRPKDIDRYLFLRKEHPPDEKY